MISTYVRKCIGLITLALAVAAGAHAEYFEGDKYIDFAARGQSSYNLSLFASVTPGGMTSASAYASFGGISGYSWGYYGEAGVAINFYGIQYDGCQWRAAYVYLYVLRPDASGYDFTEYYNVPLPSAGWAQGYTYSESYSNPLWGSID